MTCEEFERVTTTVNPWEVTRATMAAVTAHALKCEKCAQSIRDAGPAILAEHGPEEILRLEKEYEKHLPQEAMDRIKEDPEVEAIVKSVTDEERDRWIAGHFRSEALMEFLRQPKGECDGSS